MNDIINQNRDELGVNIFDNELSDDKLKHLPVETAKKMGGLGIENMHQGVQYQYTNVNTEYVINNIEEFIIPECQQACISLWSKNIETFMTSNYDDKNLYALLGKLSYENQKIFDELSKKDKRYFFSEFRHCYGIESEGLNQNSVNNLNSLTKVFLIQDVRENRYETIDDFLEGFKCQNGKLAVDECGRIYRESNPTLKDVSIIDALQASNSQDLYVEEEGRVYKSQFYLDWHKRYLNSINQK